MTEEEKSKIIQREVKQQCQQSNSFKRMLTLWKSIVFSYNTIAQQRKPLSDVEYLKEVFKNCSELLFKNFSNKNAILKIINKMPIFINTVKDRIIAIDKNATDQLLLNLK